MSSIASADVTRLAMALRESGRKSEATTFDVLQQSAGYILSEMERTVPVKSGNLRDSLGVKVTSGSVIIGPDVNKAPYATFVEHGTKPHVIKAKNGKALAFTVGGRTVIVRSVNHPGTTAQPFVMPAFETWVDSIGELAAEANIKVIKQEAS
jgi:HK97 gp10 family phage protein